MSITAEFINALFLLQNKGEVELYEGKLPDGTYTKVTITGRNGQGYAQTFYDIKQLVSIPGKNSIIRKVGIPTEEFAYKILYNAIQERYNGISRVHEDDTVSSETFTTFDASSIIDKPQPVNKAKLEHIEKVYQARGDQSDGSFEDANLFGEINPGSVYTGEKTVQVNSLDGRKPAQVRASVFDALESE